MSYWPRVSTYESRVIEQTLAGGSLLEPPLPLVGAIVEAAFAATDPPLLGRLREADVPYLVDPQSLRFQSDAYLDVRTLSRLPFAPSSPLTPDADVEEFVVRALRFQQDAGASRYLVPGVSIPDPADEWARLNERIHKSASTANGRDVDRKPLVALLAPGRSALKHRESLLIPLMDFSVDAVYVQPTKLSPTRDGVEVLVRYLRVLRSIQENRLPVFAGRVGAFGLLLEALRVDSFDSGLGEAEAFDLAAANRRRRPRPGRSAGGGRRRRVYIEQLKSTILSRDVDAIFAEPGFRSRFACTLPCCRFSGFERLAERRRQHYLRVRIEEVSRISRLPTLVWRVNQVHNDLLAARDHADAVRRTLMQRGVPMPSFDHLDRWLSTLARAADEIAAA